MALISQKMLSRLARSEKQSNSRRTRSCPVNSIPFLRRLRVNQPVILQVRVLVEQLLRTKAEHSAHTNSTSELTKSTTRREVWLSASSRATLKEIASFVMRTSESCCSRISALNKITNSNHQFNSLIIYEMS